MYKCDFKNKKKTYIPRITVKKLTKNANVINLTEENRKRLQ